MELTEQQIKDIIRLAVAEAVEATKTPQHQTMDIKAAAEYLGLTQGSIYQRVHKGEIPYHKLGAKLLFKRRELDAYLDDCRVPTNDELEYLAASHLATIRKPARR